VKLLYKYTVADAVLESFSSEKKRRREELLRIFSSLANDPFTRGDWLQKDSAGRQCEVKRFGPWVVTFWPDHLATLIHIIDVERLS
jgi:hypothetical protein